MFSTFSTRPREPSHAWRKKKVHDLNSFEVMHPEFTFYHACQLP